MDSKILKLIQWAGDDGESTVTADDILAAHGEFQTMNARIAALEAEVAREDKAIGVIGVAMDVADRLIERAYGVDRPSDWDDEWAAVTRARAALQVQP